MLNLEQEAAARRRSSSSSSSNNNPKPFLSVLFSFPSDARHPSS